MAVDVQAETARWLATMSPEELERAVSYTQGSHWLILWGFVVSVVVGWLIIRMGLLTGVRDRLNRSRSRPNLTVAAIAVVYAVLTWLLSLPWAWWSGWRRETEYGLTSQPVGGWLAEGAMSAAISTLLSAVLLIGIYALIRRAGRLWWAWAGGLTAAFIALMLLAAPIFIEPLFNTYTPAPDGPVRDAVVELAERTGTPSDKIYIYDGSRQSDRYTANVSGLFGTARVAMSDVMFQQGADLAEVRGVVGHEMGHYVHMHALWMTAIMGVLAMSAFWLADRLYPVARRLLGANRVGGIEDPAGLPVLGVVLSFLAVLATPVFNTMIRTIETDADRFSLEHANEPDGLAAALIKTAEYRAPSPSPIEEFFFYDHPSVENRIRMAMEWKAEHPPER
ncbi:M48 family metallopeptidase [Brevundimonas sp.]|uniref:M48 family metallopeptidase n=1 Tax=Brevundimonas sp. TaxID=1871086 RepID=UPI0025F3933C|nr:M48 family metallopeptidase [Brevundimonas sp.]